MGMNTIPPNPFPPSSDTMSGNAKPYELPIASTTELGGIKVGSGLAINAETGVLINNYSLPTASDETLGGVKVGSGLSMNAETGVLSATSQKWNYSTSEVNTGQKWIDGKDIYCKVYTTPLGNNITITLETGFGLTKTLVKIDPIVLGVDNNLHYQYAMGTITSINDIIICEVYESNLRVVIRDNYSIYTGYFAVYYTKTEVE